MSSRPCENCEAKGNVYIHIPTGQTHPLSFNPTTAWPSMSHEEREIYRGNLRELSCPACRGHGYIYLLDEFQFDD